MVDKAEDASPPFHRRVAARMSVAAHPFILIPVLVAVVTARSLPPRESAAVVVLVVAGSILPMLWIIVRRVRSGAWTDHDVSVREQRTRMYPAAPFVRRAASTPAPGVGGLLDEKAASSSCRRVRNRSGPFLSRAEWVSGV